MNPSKKAPPLIGKLKGFLITYQKKTSEKCLTVSEYRNYEQRFEEFADILKMQEDDSKGFMDKTPAINFLYRSFKSMSQTIDRTKGFCQNQQTKSCTNLMDFLELSNNFLSLEYKTLLLADYLFSNSTEPRSFKTSIIKLKAYLQRAYDFYFKFLKWKDALPQSQSGYISIEVETFVFYFFRNLKGIIISINSQPHLAQDVEADNDALVIIERFLTDKYVLLLDHGKNLTATKGAKYQFFTDQAGSGKKITENEEDEMNFLTASLILEEENPFENSRTQFIDNGEQLSSLVKVNHSYSNKKKASQEWNNKSSRNGNNSERDKMNLTSEFKEFDDEIFEEKVIYSKVHSIGANMKHGTARRPREESETKKDESPHRRGDFHSIEDRGGRKERTFLFLESFMKNFERNYTNSDNVSISPSKLKLYSRPSLTKDNTGISPFDRSQTILQSFFDNKMQNKLVNKSKKTEEDDNTYFKLGGVVFESVEKILKKSGLDDDFIDEDTEKDDGLSESSSSEDDDNLEITDGGFLQRREFLKILYGKSTRKYRPPTRMLKKTVTDYIENEKISPIAYFEIDRKQLLQNDGKISTRMLNFFSSHLRESVNLLAVSRLIKLKFRSREFLNYVPRIQYLWSLLRFTFRMWLIWRKNFASEDEKEIFFLDDPQKILTEMRSHSLLQIFEKGMKVLVSEKGTVVGRKELFEISELKVLFERRGTIERKCNNTEDSNEIVEEEVPTSKIVLERRYNEFNPLKKNVFLEDYVKKNTNF